MRIKDLKLENIGPFKEVELEFISKDNQVDSPPVICITGENGTGKSIIIDAIRSLFMGRYGNVERRITSSTDFLVQSHVVINDIELNFYTNSYFQKNRGSLETNHSEVNSLFYSTLESDYRKDFVMDYWTSKLSSDMFEINNIGSIKPNVYLDNSLAGIHKNVDLTKSITYFDYLKDSSDEIEKYIGSTLYSTLEEIINLSIAEGKLSHISRIGLMPIIQVGDIKISLDQLSSGNIYLIQRLTSVVNQIYSICLLNDKPISDYKSIKGVLLIDEAENHLHPKWQKVFLKNILKLFPQLQLIVTTHSPFIVSSVKNQRVFVCTSHIDHSTVNEETDFYVNKPIEEILLSPLFNTSNFGISVSELIEQRKQAIIQNNSGLVESIEKQLIEINPEYFNYLNIDSVLKSIKK